MSIDPMIVLDQLVRSGIWNRPQNLSQYRSIVLDGDGVLAYLYKQCVLSHFNRHKTRVGQSSPKSKESPSDDSNAIDLYAGTLINYQELTRHINLLLDYFLNTLKMRLIVVYEGKHMEAPLFGYLAGKFESNIRILMKSIRVLADCDNKKLDWSSYSVENKLLDNNRSQIGLIILKSIVNIRRKSGANIIVRQAFYRAAPLMARLARDYRCPVLTGDATFILFDVRAGFLLMDDKFFDRISHQTKGQDHNRLQEFCSNNLFIMQHPGLNQKLTLHLFPLLDGQLMTTHATSLRKIHVVNTLDPLKDSKLTTKPKAYKNYHTNAALLADSLTFLRGKSVALIGNLIRSEATRINTSFDVDYRQVFNYNCIGFEFKQRLRFVLKYMNDLVQLNFIERCLIDRECSADFYLSLLCCSIGHLASVNYNRYMQIEDLSTKRSAYSLFNHGRSIMLSLLSENKLHQGEQSVSASKSPKSPKSKQQQQTMTGLSSITRYKTAALTIIDRRENKQLQETVISTTYDQDGNDYYLGQFNKLRDNINMDNIANGHVVREHSIKLIELALKVRPVGANDVAKAKQPKQQQQQQSTAIITTLLEQIETEICKQNQLRSIDIRHKQRLGLIMSLFRYAFNEASADDTYFKTNYIKLRHHFEIGLVNHYCLLNDEMISSSSSASERLREIFRKNLLDQQTVSGQVIMFDYNSGTLQHGHRSSMSATGSQSVTSPTSPAKKSAKSAKSPKSPKLSPKSPPTLDKDLSKKIRHLIELFGASACHYTELNAFLDYPLPKLDLVEGYNPILLYNLVVYSQSTEQSKFLIRF